MKLKTFYANLAFLIVANLLVKPFYIFGIDRTVQLSVNEGEYGLYFALYNFSVLFYILLDLGLTQYNTRTIAQEPTLLPKSFVNFIAAKSILGLVYILIIALFAYINGYGIQAFQWLGILMANQILISFLFYCRSSIAALHKFRLDALLSVLDRILVILFCSVLLWGIPHFDFKIEHFLWAQFFAYAIATLVAAASVWFSLKNPVLSLDFKSIQRILKSSIPFALLIFLTILFTRIDAVMMERMLEDGLQEVDIYAAGFRLLDALNIIGLLFATLLFPIFSRLIKEGSSVQELSISSFKTLFFIASSAAILFFLFRNEVTELLYGSKFEVEYTASVLGILMLSFIPITSNYVFNTLLNASHHLRPLIYLALLGVVLNISLNLYFIPIHKAYGAAFATLITQYLVGLGHILLAVYFMKIYFRPRLILSIISFSALGIVGVIFIKNIMLHWFFVFLLSALFLLILGWILKMIIPSVLIERKN